jgi:arylsulfatase A-like enzyme
MIKMPFLITILAIMFVSAFARPNVLNGALSATGKPNIVLIMADDMGYSAIGCYGGEIETPVLDKLAKNGLRYTQFYNTSRCCPTRAALLAGLYSHQAGIGLMTGDLGYDAYRGDLNKQCVTLAEALKPAVCKTYMFGKWHVWANRVGVQAWTIQRPKKK